MEPEMLAHLDDTDEQTASDGMRLAL